MELAGGKLGLETKALLGHLHGRGQLLVLHLGILRHLGGGHGLAGLRFLLADVLATAFQAHALTFGGGVEKVGWPSLKPFWNYDWHLTPPVMVGRVVFI